MKTNWLALPLAVALTACGGDGESTTVSIKGGDGNAAASIGKDGTVSVKAPGFEGSIKLPKFKIGAENFEIDGVKLYPGSTISSLNIDDKSEADGDGSVHVVFDAPADAKQVTDWFREQMEGAGFTVTGKQTELAGKTSEGSAYTLKLDPAGAGKSRGTLAVTGK
ncbi:hypothetical protein [Sphingomonas sp.]|uniref:hypothetical protein n=1 Tax=Sphingomonas sp. TaxID=28214 RepID=UPI001EC0AAA8|nr:hypothetical protein [Sphingomonas sp.]MBX3595876.1 hypothetical protein [Sphingomonas sp.]